MGAAVRASVPEPPRWSWWLIVVAALGVVAPLSLAGLFGALTIPHNDSWAESTIASTFTHTGHIRMVGWNDMSLLGQIVVLAPFGISVTVQDLGVAVMAAGALYATYRIASKSVSTVPAVLIAGTLAIAPGWASLSTTYMTDVPALCAALLTVLLGHAAIERDSRAWFAGSLVLGFWAFTIREPTIAALAGVLVHAIVRRSDGLRISRRFAFVATAVSVVLMVLFKAWRSGLPMGQNPPVSLNPVSILQAAFVNLPFGWVTLGFILIPVAAAYARPGRWSRRGWVGATVSAAIVLLAWRHGVEPLDNHPAPFIGNYMSFNGEYHFVGTYAHPVIARPIWALLGLMGSIGAVLTGGAVADGWHRTDPLVRSFTAAAAAVTIGVATVGGVLYDRYLFVLVPGLASAVVLSPGQSRSPRRAGRIRQISAVASALVVGTTALAMFVNANASDRARWDAAEEVARTGISPTTIDAGLEWDGWHAPAGVVEWNDWRLGAWSLFHPDSQPCVALVEELYQPPSGWTRIRSLEYRTFGWLGHSAIGVYATGAAGCQDQGLPSDGGPAGK